MIFYKILMLVTGILFLYIAISVYCGKTGWIISYHQTKVNDRKAYGKAFGKAMAVIAAGFLVSGILGFLGKAVGSLIAMTVGLCIGIVCILVVQKKYNGGLF